MADDALETVLRLIADGRLTADEARPVLDALAARPDATTDDPARPPSPPRLPVAGPVGPSAWKSARAVARCSTCGCRSLWDGPPSAASRVSPT